MKTLTALAILGTAWLCFALYKADKREQAEITGRCASYLHDAQSHSDSLHARIACDQLWASKATKDAALAAEMMAASAAANAASASVRSSR